MEILSKYMLEIFFGLISAGALGFCRYVWKEKKRLEGLVDENKNKQLRQMILSEIEPIVAELTKIKMDMHDLETKEDREIKLIVDSYKFRLIQLCKTHLADGWITQSEFDQITELFKLYTALGGNGQAED
jgi:hypothetical protein